MIVGFCGSGNMAAAIARGWAGNWSQMLFADADAGKARKLAGELGGEAVESNEKLAERADVVVLAVKPAALDQAAGELGGAGSVVSILGATALEKVEAAFPEAEVGRIMPNLAVEVGGGVLCIAGEFSPEVREKLNVLGSVIELPDSQFDVATALMGCSPAYFALVAEALAAAGVSAGLDEKLVEKLVVEAAAGTGSLMRIRRPADVRISVTSPGGSTEAGLEALEREGAREAFEAAVQASLERMGR
ncbi:MAG TPA: pyrroline-5-carboxylate reductase dimerization domain-containing protein [Solirubrobacterales bacterium]|nr:pyrroline-5-carboxylate reductase dimerization domain-containing protein [Solirubrobacterales bacterium]